MLIVDTPSLTNPVCDTGGALRFDDTRQLEVLA
jgi:hypothetical protein